MRVPDSNGGRIRFLALGILGMICLSWVLHTLARIFAVGIDETSFMERKLDEGFIEWNGWSVFVGIHASAASMAIVAAILAMLLAQYGHWRLHRRIGIGYVLCVSTSAITGFPLALTATGGVPSTLGFFLLNAFWIVTVVFMYREAKSKRIKSHRIWAIRSFATTMANTTLTILAAVFGNVLHDETMGYQLAIWLCLPLNLCIVELWIRFVLNMR